MIKNTLKKHKIKVLQIGMTNNLGGIETFLYNHMKKIDKEKFSFDFVNIYDTDLFFSDEIKNMGGRIYKITSYYKHPIKYINELIKIIKTNEYDVVHCNMNSSVFIYPLIAAKIAGTKIIIAHSHNASSDKGMIKSLLHSIMKRFIPIFANKYIACSDKAGKWFFSKKIRNSNDYHVINNSIDTSKFVYNKKNRTRLRKQMNISEKTLVIGHVGRFNPQKNHKFIIEIAKNMKEKNIDFKILLIGIGPLMNDIKMMVEKFNLKDNILFLEQRLDVNELLSAMDIFILPSLYEGLPIVAVEAQGNGLKCFLSDRITTEVVDSDKVEFLPIDNAELWVDRIIEFKNINYDRNVVLEKFNIDKSIDKLYALYTS